MNIKNLKLSRASRNSNSSQQSSRPLTVSGNYYLGPDQYVYKAAANPGEKPLKLCRRIEIKENLIDLETGKVILVLSFDYLGYDQIVDVPRGTIYSRIKIIELADKGLDVFEHNVKDVMKFLHMHEKSAPVHLRHSYLGWDQYSGQTIFKVFHAIGCNSKYYGKLHIEPTGSFEDWLSLIEDHVMGHPQLELALIIGLSAPVASMIAKVTAMEVILVHICNDSSRGKTTAIQVAVSPFGLPDTKDGGLIKTWNGTQNAIVAHLRGIHGIPIALDEPSMSSSDDYTKTIYIVANGEEKARLGKDNEMRETQCWSGVIISDGEHSLRKKTRQNNGLRVRLLEIEGITWTESAQHADSLKQGLLQNYGHAGPEFVEYLMSLNKKSIIDRWKEVVDEVHAKMLRKDDFSVRIASKLAVFVLTAELASTALDLHFDRDRILEILLTSEQDSVDDRNMGEKAYETIKQYFVRHKAKFSTGGMKVRPTEVFGCYDSHSTGRISAIYFLPSEFDKLLLEAGYEDKTVVLKKLRELGLLITETNKLTIRKSLRAGEGRVTTYGIRWYEDIEDAKNAQAGNVPILSRSKAIKRSKTTSTKQSGVADIFNDEK